MSKNYRKKASRDDDADDNGDDDGGIRQVKPKRWWEAVLESDSGPSSKRQPRNLKPDEQPNAEQEQEEEDEWALTKPTVATSSSSSSSPQESEQPQDQEQAADGNKEDRNQGKRRLFIGNLSYDTDDAGLSEHFAQIGPVTFARVQRDPENNKSRGFGFVSFDKKDDARRALEDLANSYLDGRAIHVAWALDRPAYRPEGAEGEDSNRPHTRRARHNTEADDDRFTTGPEGANNKNGEVDLWGSGGGTRRAGTGRVYEGPGGQRTGRRGEKERSPEGEDDHVPPPTKRRRHDSPSLSPSPPPRGGRRGRSPRSGGRLPTDTLSRDLLHNPERPPSPAPRRGTKETATKRRRSKSASASRSGSRSRKRSDDKKRKHRSSSSRSSRSRSRGGGRHHKRSTKKRRKSRSSSSSSSSSSSVSLSDVSDKSDNDDASDLDPEVLGAKMLQFMESKGLGGEVKAKAGLVAPELKKARKARDKNSCHFCGSMGHLARDCPMNSNLQMAASWR